MDKWSVGFPKRAIRWKKWSSARRGAHRGHDNWRTQGQHDPRNISLTLDTASFRREYELSRIDQPIRRNQTSKSVNNIHDRTTRVIELANRKSIVYRLADIVQSSTLTEATTRNFPLPECFLKMLLVVVQHYAFHVLSHFCCQ